MTVEQLDREIRILTVAAAIGLAALAWMLTHIPELVDAARPPLATPTLVWENEP